MQSRTRRASEAKLAILALAIASSPAGTAHASSSADELVRQAHEHEAAHEEDLALRRYTEALALDRTSADAWMGLGALRLKMGDAVEAEKVYDTALAEVPTLHAALHGRARARWALARHAEAEDDLDAFATTAHDEKALEELAEWYGADGRSPAQLATWRRLLVIARTTDDAPLEKQARRMVKALVVMVDGADPAASPIDGDATRRGLARIAGRGG